MRHWRRLLVPAVVGLAVAALPTPTATFAKPRLQVHSMPTRGRSAALARFAAAEPITFHGGAVMTGHVDVFLIWYGNWPATSKRRAIITDFATHVPSPYWNINKTFPNASGKTVGDITMALQTDDHYSVGKSNLSDDQIQTIVGNAISSGHLPKSANAIYLVLTSPDVTKAGFLTEYCGWHTDARISGTTIKFGFIGDPTGPKLSSCSPQQQSPNGDLGADAMVSTIAHELDETVTDPTLNGWRTDSGEENADRCAWKYSTTYTANGATANMKLGSRDYLIQSNWVNSATPHCGLTP